jgi:AcrR family transcriptional regulator
MPQCVRIALSPGLGALLATETSAPAQRMGAVERREQILACAMRHFEQRSYNEVSTAEIAKDAGVGRPLIHHYFGTKRELYLEVVRRLSFVPSYVPAAAVKDIPPESLAERIEASIDRWLTVAWRHRSMWISTITMDSAGRDKEVGRILQQADEIAADRMLEALGLADSPDYARLRVMTLA